MRTPGWYPMRPTMSIRSPALLVTPLRKSSRLFMFVRHVQPRPANTPLRPCHVRPRLKSIGDLIVELNPTGRIDPAVATTVVLVARELFEYSPPGIPAVRRSDLREGMPAPRPQRNPLVSSTPEGVPRTMKPA